MLGGGLFVIAILFAGLCLIAGIRPIALRLSAIFALSALTLFANNVAVYFPAIFIIATAVTKLEFLHVLAAIVRGDKNYFDFRKESLTREEALRKIGDEANIAGDAQSVPQPLAVDAGAEPLRIPAAGAPYRAPIASIAFQLEERALDWYQKRSGGAMQRHVRIRGAAGSLEVDAVVEGGPRASDTLIEVKWIRDSRALVLRKMADGFSGIVRRYNQITQRRAELVLLLVSPAEATIPDSVLAMVRESLSNAGVMHRIVVVSYADLRVEQDAAPPIADDDPQLTAS